MLSKSKLVENYAVESIKNTSPIQPNNNLWINNIHQTDEKINCRQTVNHNQDMMCMGTIITYTDNNFSMHHTFYGLERCKGDKCACFSDKRILDAKSCKLNSSDEICCKT